MSVVGKVFAWFFLVLVGVVVVSGLFGQGRSSAAQTSKRWLAGLLIYVVIPLSLIGILISLWHHEWIDALVGLGVTAVVAAIARALESAGGGGR